MCIDLMCFHCTYLIEQGYEFGFVGEMKLTVVTDDAPQSNPTMLETLVFWIISSMGLPDSLQFPSVSYNDKCFIIRISVQDSFIKLNVERHLFATLSFSFISSIIAVVVYLIKLSFSQVIESQRLDIIDDDGARTPRALSPTPSVSGTDWSLSDYRSGYS